MITAGLIAAGILTLVLMPQGRQLIAALGDLLTHAELLRQQVENLGQAGPPIYVAIQVAQVVLAPIPGEVSGLVGGYLFGGWAAFIYSTIGLTIGSVLAFFAGRFIGNMFPERFRAGETYKKFNRLVEGRDFLLPLILFVFPGFPKDSLSYLLGASDMDWRLFTIIAGLGRVPGTLVLSFQGAQVYNHDWRGLILFTLAAGAVFVPMFLFRHRLVTAIAAREAKR